MRDNGLMKKPTVKKPVLVLLPGYDGDGTHSFAKLVRSLSGSYETLPLDFPYIRSAEKAYSLDELVRYVHAKIGHYRNVHVLGFSMGGFVAVRYAELYPGQVKSLILVSSAPILISTPAIRVLTLVGTRIVRNRTMAAIFTAVYCAPLLRFLVKYSPLPVPKVSIPPHMGYSYFGTLGKVITSISAHTHTKIMTSLHTRRSALLFRDDLSFPADSYGPLMSQYGFAVTTRENGGHATARNYWDQVTDYLLEYSQMVS